MTNWDGLSERRGDGGLHPEARVQFAEIKQILVAIKDTQAAHQADDEKRFSDQETRLRTLEKGWWKASGAAAVIGGAIAYLGKHFGS
jgi:hypothetical protein